jgi:hypothetical protein
LIRQAQILRDHAPIVSITEAIDGMSAVEERSVGTPLPSMISASIYPISPKQFLMRLTNLNEITTIPVTLEGINPTTSKGQFDAFPHRVRLTLTGNQRYSDWKAKKLVWQ